MAKQRRVIGAKEKAKVAIAALRDQKTARELATQFKTISNKFLSKLSD